MHSRVICLAHPAFTNVFQLDVSKAASNLAAADEHTTLETLLPFWICTVTTAPVTERLQNAALRLSTVSHVSYAEQRGLGRGR
jgi:hypothetical protein